MESAISTNKATPRISNATQGIKRQALKLGIRLGYHTVKQKTDLATGILLVNDASQTDSELPKSCKVRDR